MLLEKFESICGSAPCRPAVVAGGQCLSYGVLDEQSSQLARFLVAEALVPSGAVVAIYLPRTVDILVCMLGIMRSGAAYTVVENDGEHAANHHRLTAMAPAAVLCDAAQVAPLRQLGLHAFDCAEAQRWAGKAQLPVPAQADTAYVLFTSGSTGTPKGVAVTHGNIAHYTNAIAERLDINSGLRYAHVSTLAADLGNTSLFLSLASGGTLHLLESELRRDPAAMRDYLLRHEIEFLKITPSHWNAIFSSMTSAHIDRLNLSYLVLGGEALPVSLARRILCAGVTRVLANHYGPTETTVGVTTYVLTTLEQLDAISTDSVPIGLPLGSTALRVRTEGGDFLDKDATGELYIGGPSVSAGYVGNAAATSASFVSLGAAGRFYKSGDQVSIDARGVVSFLGRVDRQVKVNGYRVELEHIESVLRTARGVNDAAVFFVEVCGKPRIVAALLSPRTEPAFDWLCQQITVVLPEYMIPKHFVKMEAFPRNQNGKTDLKVLKAELLRRLSDAQPVQASALHEPVEPGLLHALRSMWRASLRVATFGDDDSFFDLGGDSLDAIQLIAQLQADGHYVTAKAFLKRPTINGLLHVMSVAPDAPLDNDRPASSESRDFSAAQDFFFRQCLSRPDHYNQAVLLQCAEPVNMEHLRATLTQLFECHASLRTSYRSDSQGRVARLTSALRPDALSVSSVPQGADESAMADHIEREARRVHERISLSDGSLFHAHVFKVDNGTDQLLLVAHHVAVDVISWRLLVSDLSRLYANLQAGTPSPLPKNPHSFWDWAGHLNKQREALQAKATSWLEAQARLPRLPGAPSNTEGAATTLWLSFSRDETEALTRDLPATLATPFHVILLAAFAQVLARSQRAACLTVDVESHGRVVFDDSIDISRVVGWHTSTFPLALSIDPHSLIRTVKNVADAHCAVPDLGVAFGLAEAAANGAAVSQVSAPVCFNYLGEVSFHHDPRFPLQPSTHAPGRARADANHRGHELKFTARLREGQLVADLSFPASTDESAMQAVMHGLKSELLALLGRAPSTTALLTEAGTRTGLITYVPRQLLSPDDRPQPRRHYDTVMLTGATGYMGVHVLMELLQQSQAQVVCVVRGKEGSSPAQRLHEAIEWYFPGTSLASFGNRVSVVGGNVSQPKFGLEPALYEDLSASVDAVYHFAADTRLFGPEEEFRRNNVLPVQACIDFAQHRRPKDLHYMSTLAVSGVNAGAEPVVYSEDSMDVGQEFQNFYESTKHEAECLLHHFRVTGHCAFIYRAGNVSGHSRTGRFQRNAADNRFVQFLAACVKVGKLPRDFGDAIVLSPIDEVVAGIVAISLHPGLKGGVFHVDSPHETPVKQVFDALKNHGLALEESQHASFGSLFREVRDSSDPDLALGYFWAMRKPRNVRYDHERTHRVLHELGRFFRPPRETWLLDFTRSLAEQGVFDCAVRGKASRTALAQPDSVM